MFFKLFKRTQPASRPRKRLLVGSVYGPSERNPHWLRLQLDFLRRTVTSFDHAVYLNRVDPALFPESTVVGRSAAAFAGNKYEHAHGLERLLDYYFEHPEYENFLILDSDAFPIVENWLDVLLGQMQGSAEIGEKHFAAAVRTEKLDTFPHPCVCFIRGRCLPRRFFDFQPRPYLNLSGRRLAQPGTGQPTVWRGRHVFFPLTRTNVRNPHPLVAAIYGGLFYHHGAGSHPIKPKGLERLRRSGHVLEIDDHDEVERTLFQRLLQDPESHLRQLTAA